MARLIRAPCWLLSTRIDDICYVLTQPSPLLLVFSFNKASLFLFPLRFNPNISVAVVLRSSVNKDVVVLNLVAGVAAAPRSVADRPRAVRAASIPLLAVDCFAFYVHRPRFRCRGGPWTQGQPPSALAMRSPCTTKLSRKRWSAPDATLAMVAASAVAACEVLVVTFVTLPHMLLVRETLELGIEEYREWLVGMLQDVDCYFGQLHAVAFCKLYGLCIGVSSSSEEIIEEDRRQHWIVVLILCILEHVQRGDRYISCKSCCCTSDLRQDDELSEDVAVLPFGLILQRQMREPSLTIPRSNGRIFSHLGSVMLPSNLLLNGLKPLVQMPARLLGESLALRLASTCEVPEGSGCGVESEFSTDQPSDSGRCLPRLWTVYCTFAFLLMQLGTICNCSLPESFVLPFVGL